MSVNQSIKRIIISRSDAIGDVILTLPICGIIKKKYPEAQIIFLGRTYTQPVVSCCRFVDEFVNADELLKKDKKEAIIFLAGLNADVILHVFPHKKIAQLAKQSGIKLRIGTTNRLFHWGFVNKLVRLSRKNSPLHESQLNCKLLEPLGIHEMPELTEMPDYYGFTNIPVLKNEFANLLEKQKCNVILHPKSNASAREWSLDHFKALIDLLPSEKFKIFISGTDKEKALLSDWIKFLPAHVVDITGKMPLDQFIAFISKADFLVAASTGPLHIAAAIGIGAIGLYPPMKPIHPGRWKPIGKKAIALCIDKTCFDCKQDPKACHCINEIMPAQVAAIIQAPQS